MTVPSEWTAIPTSTVARSNPDRIAMKAIDGAVLTAGTGLLGGVLGYFLPPVLGWLLSLSWVPMHGPLELLGRLTDHTPVGVLAAVGVVLGVLAGLVLVHEAAVLVVNPREIVILDGRTRKRFARSQVAGAIIEGRHLSLLDARDVELVRQEVFGDRAVLAETLRRHDWPLEHCEPDLF